jgi:hypothetical protein
MVIFMPRPLYPRRKNPRYPLDRKLSVPQNRSGRHGEEKILDPIGTRTPTPRSSSPKPVATPITLPQLTAHFNTIFKLKACFSKINFDNTAMCGLSLQDFLIKIQYARHVPYPGFILKKHIVMVEKRQQKHLSELGIDGKLILKYYDITPESRNGPLLENDSPRN